MPVVTGRERASSSANKRGPPPQASTRNRAQTGPPPKRRLSSAGNTIRPSIEFDDSDEDMPFASQEPTTETQDVALDDDDDDDTVFGDEAIPDVEVLLGDVPEKKIRSYKEVADNLEMLLRIRDEKREEARQFGEEMDIDKWLLAGNHLRRIYRGTEPLSPQEVSVNEMMDMTEATQRLTKLIEDEQGLLRSRDFTAPGYAQPVPFERDAFAEHYDMEEALRRSSPVVEAAFIRGNATWKKPPVVAGARMNKLVEGGVGWNPLWKTLDHPDLNLDTAILQLRETRERSERVDALTPLNVRESIRRSLKSTQTKVYQLQMIRAYFANGYTFHPNQLVGPNQMPTAGFCSRAMLYLLVLCFRRLITIREKDRVTGLNMSPVDFLRWRLAVLCKDHNHEDQYKNRGSIANCLRHIYRTPAVRMKRGGDPLFREVMKHGARLEGHPWQFERSRRGRRVTQAEEGSDSDSESSADTADR